MTEKEIMQYRSMKRLIERKQSRLDELWDKPIDTLIGKVTASSKQFPYVVTHPSVYIDDPVEVDRREKIEIKLQKEIEVLEKKVLLIEEFIDTIQDTDIRYLFEMRVYDGMKWIEIAEELGEDKDRTTYSKKFKKYLENSHISPISQK